MAAVGLGLSITSGTGSLLVDIGGGTTDIAVLSFGGIVYSRSLRIGGRDLDQVIVNYLRMRHHLLIGERTAEQIKIEIGSAAPLNRGVQLAVVGRDLISGLPKEVTLCDTEIREALEETVQQIVSHIRAALEHTPPELLADIRARGVALTGGGSLLANLDQRIRNHFGLPVTVPDDAFNNVVVGASQVLRDKQLLQKLKVRESLPVLQAAA